MKEIFGVDKPSGITSSAVVDFVKQILTYKRQQQESTNTGSNSRKRKAQFMEMPTVEDIAKLSTTGRTDSHKRKRIHWPYKDIKCGHGGTLDPLATGVLVIGVGAGTKKLQGYLKDCTKTYMASFTLGTSTDTQDQTGVTVATCDHISHSDLTKNDLEEQIRQKFLGDIEQTPPSYSAIRIDGKRLHQIAREAEKSKDVVVPQAAARKVQISQCDVLEFDGTNGQLRVTCSSGTYIRTLIHDIAQAMGCQGHMTALIREKQGDQSIENALKMEDLLEQ